jgi:hypothetical protein
LLTISIKVNVPATAESQFAKGTTYEEAGSRALDLELSPRFGFEQHGL